MVNPDSNIKPKILYVDDESINLRLFKISFKGNYNVTTISSGEQALEIIKDIDGIIIQKIITIREIERYDK